MTGCKVEAEEVVGVDLRAPTLKLSGETWAFDEATLALDVCPSCAQCLKAALMVVEVERFLSGQARS
jgi:hypothetical protein